jgi:predicted secreted protein
MSPPPSRGDRKEEGRMLEFLSAFAVYFIIWWITLFAVLPIGLRTQAEEDSVVPGTVESAPAQYRPLRVMLLTTGISAAIFAVWYLATSYFGFGMDNLPRMVPNFY